MREYPKMLYGAKGLEDLNNCVTVQNADEEKMVRETGYHDISDPKDVKAAKEAADLAAKEKE